MSDLRLRRQQAKSENQVVGRVRVIFVVVSIVLIIVSFGLIAFGTTSTQYYSSLEQTTVCQQSYANLYYPGGVLVKECAVAKGYWFEASANSLSGKNFTLQFLLDATGQSQQLLVYNFSGTDANVDIPILINGTLFSRIGNIQTTSNSLNGSFTVYSLKNEETAVPYTAHAYSFVGSGLLALSFISLFLLVWNPYDKLSFEKKTKAQFPLIKPEKLGGGTTISKSNLGRAFKDISFLRSVIMIGVQTLSALLLVYSLYFLYVFRTLGNTTSYFPWAWKVFTAEPSTVSSLFYTGFGISIAFLTVSSLLLFRRFLPAFRKSWNKVPSTIGQSQISN